MTGSPVKNGGLIFMTTHYEKIQALGNRMASNLETMGVSASFNDGGLTLADKILQIQHFNDGLLLYADKNIIQIGDTVNLYALLLEDGIPQSNAEIEFFVKGNSPTLRTLTADTDNDVSPKYSFASMPTFSDSSERVYLDADHSIYLLKYGSNQVQLCIGRSSTVCTPGITSISLDNNILTFTGNGGTVNADVSDKDMSVIYSDVSGVTINDYYSVYTAVTNSCGVATVSYTGKGTGVLNIQAYNPERIISSIRYAVLDCIAIDNATLSDHQDIWLNTAQSGVNFERKDEYTELTITVSQNRYIPLNASISGDFAIEMELYQNQGGNSMDFVADTTRVAQWGMPSSLLNTFVPILITFKDNTLTLKYLNSGNTTTLASNVSCDGFRLLNYATIAKILRFKNFRIYSI